MFEQGLKWGAGTKIFKRWGRQSQKEALNLNKRGYLLKKGGPLLKGGAETPLRTMIIYIIIKKKFRNYTHYYQKKIPKMVIHDL